MNSKKMMMIGSMVGLVAGMAACGGNSGSGDNSSGSTASAKYIKGPITAFGSVYVNGSRYNTDSATVYIEGNQGKESDLRVGMMVSVEASADGKAKSIHFSDELEGIVVGKPNIGADGIGSMMVMGQTVTLTGDTIFESKVNSIVTAADIAAGNIVEVSGQSTAPGAITATRVEVKALDMASYKASHAEGVELKGVVAGHNESDSFTLGGQVVIYSDTTRLDDMPIGNWDGLYVEVKSTAGLDAGQLVASKIELENGGSKEHHGDENDEMEVMGAISAVTDTSVTINDQTFLLNDSTRYEHGVKTDLVVGVMVKAEGSVDANGDLVAREISFGGHDDADANEINGTVTAINATDTNAGSIEIAAKNGAVMTVLIDNSTIMHDSGMGHTHFNLSDLAVDDKVEVDAVRNDDGTYTAIKLERKKAQPVMPSTPA